MRWKQIVIAAAVILLAAVAILVLRHVAANRDAEETTVPAESATIQAEGEAASARQDEAEPDAHANETVTFPKFSFTQKDDKVYATVMGGDGQTEFDGAEENPAEVNMPTAGKMYFE